MIVLDLEQGSDAWLQARLGKASASRIADITARTKSGWSASRANYAAELISERLTGVPAEKFVSGPMLWGKEKEAEACALYGLLHDAALSRVGLVMHPRIEMACASPDRLVGDKGLLETKCPTTATHINYLLGGSIDGKYIAQTQWQMCCTGREWCDWASYDPRLSPEMQLEVRRVERDDRMIAELEREVAIFLEEVAETVAKLQARYQIKAEAAE